MKLEYNYEYDKEEDAWISYLVLTKDDGTQKASVLHHAKYLTHETWLQGFKSQIRAINEELANES